MPVPKGYVEESYQPDVAFGAQQYTHARKSGSDIPPNSPLAQKSDTRGYWHSLANSLGIPLNLEELGQMGPTALANMYLPGLGSAVNTISGLGNSHSFQDVNRVLNPLAAPMEQMGGGNVAGGLGSATPFLATALAAPFIPGPKMPPGEAAPGAEGINLLKPRPQKAGPAQIPVYGKAPNAAAPGLVRRGLQATAQEVLPGGLNRIAQAVLQKTSPAKPPVIGSIDKPILSRLASNEYTKSPVDSSFRQGSVNWQDLPDESQPAGSPPLRPIGDWFRPIKQAAYGDAPVQPIEFSRPFDAYESLQGINKQPTNNPIGTVWAGQPSQPPIPLNDAAFEAHGTPAPYITRSALAGNTQFMPGYQQLPEGQPGASSQPGASPGIASPVSPFSEQSFAYLRNLMEMNRLKYAQNLTDGANRINK